MICTKDEGVFARSARSTTAYGPLLSVSGRTLPASIFVEIIHEDPIFGFAELGGKQRIKKAENDTRMSVWETC